jgi:hypothetical protein
MVISPNIEEETTAYSGCKSREDHITAPIAKASKTPINPNRSNGFGITRIGDIRWLVNKTAKNAQNTAVVLVITSVASSGPKVAAFCPIENAIAKNNPADIAHADAIYLFSLEISSLGLIATSEIPKRIVATATHSEKLVSEPPK